MDLKIKFPPFLLLLFVPLFTYGQGSVLDLGYPNYHLLNRLEILSGTTAPYHTEIRSINRKTLGLYTNLLDSVDWGKSQRDAEDIQRLIDDNNEWLVSSEYPTTLGGEREASLQKVVDSTGLTYYQDASQATASTVHPKYTLREKPFLKYFYHSPANLFEANGKHYYLRINPILNLQMAKGTAEDGEDWTYHNQRGLLVRGGVDDRLFFNINFRETQTLFPWYVRVYESKYKSLPGNGHYKTFRAPFLPSDRALDYLNGEGFLGFNVTRHVGMQFGHGRNFIGNGYRSLLLSDFSQNYLYLKINWHLGAVHYQNIFSELTALSSNANPEENLLPKKYMAAHYLSFKHKNIFSIGLFESIIFNRDGETGRFEFNYLNPVIFYRSVEHLIDSPDNTFLGANFHLNLWKRVQFYGQFILDEFRFEELVLNNNGWWGNKYGAQAGVKYLNAFGIEHLDLQAELNIVRPYTYTHEDSLGSSYTHYSQSLAHPLGANFKEYIGKVRYHPIEKLILEGRLIRYNQGESTPTENWGEDINAPNRPFVREYGNEIGQGVSATTTLLGMEASYELFHNCWLDLTYFYRKKESADPDRSLHEQYIGGGLRMNINKLRLDF